MMGPNSLDVKHPQCEFYRVDAALLVWIISPERHSSPLHLPERALHCKGYSPDIAPDFFSSVRVRVQPLALVAGWEVKNPDALSAANVATEPTLDGPTTSQLNRVAGFSERNHRLRKTPVRVLPETLLALLLRPRLQLPNVVKVRGFPK